MLFLILLAIFLVFQCEFVSLYRMSIMSEISLFKLLSKYIRLLRACVGLFAADHASFDGRYITMEMLHV